MTKTIYDFVCKNINGEPVDMAQFKGKVLIIVNTASYCGFSLQYKGLEQLYRDYKSKGVVVLGFPSNQFAEEPYDNERINSYCLLNYGVSFPMFSKIKVNGENAEPLYLYLQKAKTGFLGSERLHWNFTKFIVDREGNVIARYSPLMFPSRLRHKIDAIL